MPISSDNSVVLHGLKLSRWCHPDDVIVFFFSLLSGLNSNCEIIHVDTESAGSFHLHGCVGFPCMTRTLFVTSLLGGTEGFFPVCLYYKQYCMLACCSYFIMHLCEDLSRAYTWRWNCWFYDLSVFTCISHCQSSFQLTLPPESAGGLVPA